MLRAYPLLGNGQRLDGGAMFGNAPRAIWQKWHPPDDAGRIPLACRALLIDDGKRRVLLETGVGAFFSPELRSRYGVVEDDHVLITSLSKLGLSHSDIDFVVLSHLHFDHAGGLLAAYEREKPHRLLFDRARFLVSQEAFERAKSPHARDRASFIPDLPELLEKSGRLCVVKHPTEASDLLGNGYSFRVTSGHTPGMLHTTVRGAHCEIFFCADLVPGRAWVHLPITMGYDRFPERLIDEKEAIFGELVERRTWLFFTHDPRVAGARLRHDGERYRTEDDRTDASYWDLDESS